ncbi:MAG: M14 family zinc carboxypeptidase [Candidatus Latescibacteria bacterium]|nr:M14 family zinc carboxypeptidase [Candidatus Latescibacterota bacterium]
MRTHGSGEYLILVAGIFLLAPEAALAQPRGYENHQVVSIEVAGEAQLEALRILDAASRDLEIWSESLRAGVVEARVSRDQKRELDAAGFGYTVLIENLQARIDEMYADQGHGFFDEYRTYEEHLALMRDLAARYPTLARTVDLGRSVQGRALMALRITGPGASKVGLLYHGAQHGNEQGGAMLVAYVAEHLLANYATDPEIRALVDNAEWYLLPIMNPDGYAVYERYNWHGFDLNRNWGSPGSGPHPFSEPETAAVRDFFLAHPNVRLYLDVHGYEPWFGWPWARTSVTCPDDDAFHSAGDAVRNLIAAAGGASYAIGAISEVTYPVTGSSVDFSYGDLHQWAYALELASPAIPEIYDHYVSSLLFLASWVSDCNGNGIPDLAEIAGGGVPDVNDNGIPDACDIASGHFVDVPTGLAIRLTLHESRPNPFNPRTTIAFDLPQDMAVDLCIYDVRGARICTLVDTELLHGSHEAVWDGRDASGRGMASGSYFARLEAGGRVETVRMCLVR